MTTSPTLSKLCSICAQLKPLSAFLHFTDDKTEYGAICSDCRKAGYDEKPAEKDSETRTTTGATIDSKTKVQGDTDKKLELERTEEEYHEDRDENETEELLITEKQLDTNKQQIKHRQSYLDKPRVFTQKSTDQNNSKWAQLKINEDATQQKESALEEQKKTEIDLTAPVEDTRIAGKIKFSGDAFKRFATLVKSGSPIGKTFSDASTVKNNEAKETPSEFIENNWGPKGKR